jgi:crotonobetaine/carnitine-CoA ligase
MYPDVVDVAAIPVPSEFSEDEVMIVVSALHGRELFPMDLFRFLESRMAHFMLPSYIRVMPELPKTPTQKIRKDLLRAEGITADTWFRGDHGIEVRRKKHKA